MSTQPPYPPPEAQNRAVLVKNISHIATSAAIEEFFSFCGSVTSHRLRTVPPTGTNPDPTLEAVVIFSDERVCADALVLSGSSIVDQPVEITRVPEGYDFSRPQTRSEPRQNPAGMFAAFGDLFSGVGTAVAAEVDKASRAIDSATDSGVLKAAKEQVALATQKTKEFAVDLDDKWHVRNSLLNTVETGKAKATEVASVVAEQTTKVAADIDSTLHISENTGKLANKARENEVVNNGFLAFAGGWQTLMTQTGLGGSPQPQGANPQQLQSNTNSSTNPSSAQQSAATRAEPQ